MWWQITQCRDSVPVIRCVPLQSAEVSHCPSSLHILFSPLSAFIPCLSYGFFSASYITCVWKVFQSDLANLQMAAFVEYYLEYPKEKLAMEAQMGKTVLLIHEGCLLFYSVSVCLKEDKQLQKKCVLAIDVCEIMHMSNRIGVRFLNTQIMN